MSTEATTSTASAATTSTAATTTPAATTTSGVGEHWGKEWIQGDFTLNPKALERVPEHLKPLVPTLSRQKTFEDVLTVMHNQQVLAGKKALAPLPADAPKEVLAERKALLDGINGVPKEPKDYGITRPQDLPEDQWNQPLADAFTAWAHKHSVSPTAAKELLQIQMDGVKQGMASQNDYVQKFFQGQEAEFQAQIKAQGVAPEKAQALVEKGALALGLDIKNPAHADLLKNANARLMAMRHALATGEDKFVEGGRSPSETTNPGALASDAIHNPANPLYPVYWNKEGKYSREQQADAVAKVNELWRQASAGQPQRGRR